MPSSDTAKPLVKILDRNFVVAIGASAGGLQALEAFFSSLPQEPGASFVVVQHLSPDFPSLMVELLQRRTKLSVCLIENEMTLALNTVYVIPPGYMVSLQGQQLLLEERHAGTIDYQIDFFFLSLVREWGERTIGILLSGTGRDGTEGLKAISRAGGIALVQSQETAQFGAMPNSPVSSGLVDEILSPEELARSVYDIIRYSITQASLSSEEKSLLPTEQLDKILNLLQQQENIDFSQYKLGTLHRRIVHRLLLSKAKTVEQYIKHLSNTPDEVKHLCQDLLIGATRFFRDPDMWSLLQTNVLPPLIEALKPGQPLRIWSAACSTGEEAYSLVIAADEVMRQMGKKHIIKLFATDVDQEALLIASGGLYPEAIACDVGSERLARYFNEEPTGYRIKKIIRSKVVFASQDLTKNPGFSQIHLVSCRNLLIYMKTNLQEQVLKLLHFSLTAKGVLILGPSEHLGTLSHAFECIDSQWNLYHKRQDVKLSVSRVIKKPFLQLPRLAKSVKPPVSSYEHLLTNLLALRFGERPTTCVLVDENYQILHLFMNTAQLLEFPLGVISTYILDIVPRELRLPLSTALHRTNREQKNVLYSDIQISDLEKNQRINLWVGRTKYDSKHIDGIFIVILELVDLLESETSLPNFEYDPDSDLSREFRELEFDLQQTRENLQSSIEELEMANEEQQATNEELLTSNEELQSTNEELQSVNEELYTVNAENQQRIEQLIELGTDIDNLLQSTDIGVVFLDRELNIRKFTPAAAQVFNFRFGDAGRPLDELVNHLDIDKLIPMIQQVAQTQTPQETEAKNLKTGDQLLLRILPYSLEDESTDGIVLTLIVINDLKQVQAQLLQSNQLLEEIYSTSPVGLCVLDQDLRFVRVNQVLADIDHRSIEEHLNQPLSEILPEISDIISTHCQQVMNTGQTVTNIEINRQVSYLPSGEISWIFNFFPVKLDSKQVGVGIIVTDITEQQLVRSELQESKAFLQQIADTSPATLTIFDLSTSSIVYTNLGVECLIGYTPEEIYEMGHNVLECLIHPDDLESFQDHLNQVAENQNGEILTARFQMLQKDGTARCVYQQTRLFTNNGEEIPSQCLGVITDITELVEAQKVLQHNNNLLRNTLNSTSIVLFNQDLDLRYTWVHNPIPGFSIDDMLGHRDRDLLPLEKAEHPIALKREVLDTGETIHHEITLDIDDTVQHFDMTYAPRYNSNQEIVGLTGVGIDITHIKQSKEKLQNTTKRLEYAQQIAHIGDWEYDPEIDRVMWSVETFRITGFDPTRGEPSLREIFSIIHEDDRLKVTDLLSQLSLIQNRGESMDSLESISSGNQSIEQTSFNMDIRIYPRGEDTLRHIHIIACFSNQEYGRRVPLFGTIMDITEQKQLQEDLQRQVFFDPLTELTNRAFFLEHLKMAVGRASRDPSRKFAVLYLDVDDFKDINDTLGHATGDELLTIVAERLEDSTRPGDIVSRLGGDEFAILLERSDNSEIAMDVAFRIQSIISKPISLSSTQLSVTISIGIAFHPPEIPYKSATSVLENADIAMYQAKRRGPGNIELFRNEMRSERFNQLDLKGAIQQAIEQEQFVLHYQPLVDLSSRSLMGFEVLVRWQHPQRGLLAPLDFLPIAQASHLMPKLENFIIKQACQQLSYWQQEFDLSPSFRLHVNISPDFLKHSSFINNLRVILSESAIQTQYLCLELTENSFIGYSSLVDSLMVELKKLGVSISLDDFGTGYSSLSYLHRLPIDLIKIDQSFIQSLDTDSSLMSITKGISDLARQIGIEVIAEGIETVEQLKCLQNFDCPYGQGYWFSHPVPPEAAEQILENSQFLDNKF
ncbi:putative Protein-glutamate O-methyltransferase [Hyella patelloides LEGE 07179]|uniref:Uncharacterized protein n=1 Tax=Hyella patelloides LEGE 07179 TaxID=945734 RepID=A0A563VNP2_9CYAN|nr:EAL domain-containing protein [Hyella patelloides]VEP13039.1 putative Protein-glutamate O-methyltransferase [Hyella patelloides LEGE 07179]